MFSFYRYFGNLARISLSIYFLNTNEYVADGQNEFRRHDILMTTLVVVDILKFEVCLCFFVLIIYLDRYLKGSVDYRCLEKYII